MSEQPPWACGAGPSLWLRPGCSALLNGLALTPLAGRLSGACFHVRVWTPRGLSTRPPLAGHLGRLGWVITDACARVACHMPSFLSGLSGGAVSGHTRAHVDLVKGPLTTVPSDQACPLPALPPEPAHLVLMASCLRHTLCQAPSSSPHVSAPSFFSLHELL